MIDLRWHKAAILGSVWASIEIVLGSFLHNIKFPLTGTILSGVGILLLVAGHSLWKEKGIVWRAGIICAVMKSVSPSSVILGPMAGITVEAFIVEAAIRLFAGNTFGYILGGAVACTTPLIQKTISYLFVYGMNIVSVFEKLVQFASNSLNLPSLDSTDIVLTVVGINLVFGGIASSFGISVGKRARFYSEQRPMLQTAQGQSDNLKQSDFQFSMPLLFLNLAVLISGLIIQSIFFMLYVPLCVYHYPIIRKRFRKISFWVEIGVVSILTGIILGEFTLSDRMEGFFIGLQMFLRALFVVSVFSAINVEIRNPVIVGFLFRKHLKTFLTALDTAFGALPSITDALLEEKSFFQHPIDSLSKILSHAAQIIYEQKASANVFILTGDTDSGKTKRVEELSARLKKTGARVGGIIQRKVLKNDKRHGYNLFDIRSQKSLPLCRADAPDAGIVAGPFKFYPEAFQFGSDSLAIANIRDCDVVILDEAGPLEIKDKGWSVALKGILQSYSGTFILVIREFLVTQICNKFGIVPVGIWNLSEVEIETILKHIHVSMRQK